MWLKIFLDEEVIELSNAMARHLPARLHIHCPTLHSAAYALAGETTKRALYVALVALDQGRWPRVTLHTERLSEWWPDLVPIAERLQVTVGDVYQVALGRSVWMVTKPPKYITRSDAASILGSSRWLIPDWERRGLIPKALGTKRRVAGLVPEPMIEGMKELYSIWRYKSKRWKYLNELEEIMLAAKTEHYEKGVS